MTHHDLFRQIETATYGGLPIGAVVGLVLLASTVLSGCLALGAGAAAGSAAARGGHIDYYLATNEVSPRIERHMAEKEICTGMSKTEVRVVMLSRLDYPMGPSFTSQVGGTEKWTYDPHDSGMPKAVITFEDGHVSSHSNVL